MKLAVTGANGFVGREVLKQAEEAGLATVPLVRKPSLLPHEVVTGDLADGTLDPKDLAGCDTIIHLAARTHVMQETASDPMAEYRRTNVEGTRRLLEAGISAGVRRFVFVSSIKAVGEWSLPGEPLRPETAPRPEDEYGKSKLEAEALVRQQCEAAGIDWVIIRPPLVHGLGVKGNMQRLLGLVKKGLPLPFGAVGNARSIVSVRNLAAAMIAASNADQAAGRVLHISDMTLSTGELVRELGQSVGARPRLLPVPASLMMLAARMLGREDEARRLLGSLELESVSSWRILEMKPPFDPRKELHAAMRQ